MVTAYILGQCDVRLWGLTSRQRLLRQLASLGVTEIGSRESLASQGAQAPQLAADASPGDASALLLREDYLFEPRTLDGLLHLGGVLMDGTNPAAAYVPSQDAPAAAGLLETGAAPAGADWRRLSAGDLNAFAGDLRLAAPPLLEAISAGKAGALEDLLYGVSYKGITDFVTKWWWPGPAKVGVRLCARWGLSPNSVTLTGFILMLATCWLFYGGWHLAGLLLAWFMTYLDTVDGKLARVTVQASRLGHVLDHGMDIIHPPFWYWFWGLSLAPMQPILGLGFETLLWCIFGGYVGGRLIEGAFHALGEVSLFAWRPFDAYFRLFTARRNPCLVLLTLAWLAGAPHLGFWLVAVWTLLSTLVLTLRLAWAAVVRARRGPLRSWLAAPNAAQRHPRAYRTFSSTRGAHAG